MFDLIFNGLDALFEPLVALDPMPHNPVLTIFVIAFLVSLITTVANKLLVDQDEMAEIQAEMKEYQKKLRDAQQKGDGKELAKLQAQQGEVMQKQSKMMSNSFKPMIVTFIPIILVFWWMRAAIGQTIIHLPEVVYYLTLTPLWHTIGPMLYGGKSTIPFAIGWLLWYMICTFGMSQILRKFLGFKQGF